MFGNISYLEILIVLAVLLVVFALPLALVVWAVVTLRATLREQGDIRRRLERLEGRQP